MTKPRSVNATGTHPKLPWTSCFIPLMLHKYYTSPLGKWPTPAAIQPSAANLGNLTA